MLIQLFRNIIFSGFTLILIGSTGCSNKYEKQVIISIEDNQAYAAPIMASFSRQYPQDEFELIQRRRGVNPKQHSSAAGAQSAGDPPVSDVAWSTDLIQTLQWKKSGLLKSRTWDIPKGWPTGFRANDGTWIGIAGRGRILLVNDLLVNADASPKSVWELGAPHWQGKSGVACYTSPSSRAHFTIVASQASKITLPESLRTGVSSTANALDFGDWLSRIETNAQIYDSEIDVANAISAGQIYWGLVDSDVAIAARDRNTNLRIIFPDQIDGGFGTVLLPTTISVLKNAKNPKVAEKLADFLVSNDVEARLTISDNASIPINPSPKELSRLLKGTNVRWAEVNIENLTDVWDNVKPMLEQKLQSNQHK